MKRRLFTFALAALTIGLLGSCSKISERIDGLDNRVGNIENEKIASIENQIAAINASIADLGTIRQDITDQKAASETLGKRIDTLKAYVGDLSRYAEKDWATALFATLDELTATKADLEVLRGTVNSIDTAISNLETRISTLKDRVSAIEAMIQSVTIVPAYIDGSVEATKDGVLHLDIIVTPAEAVAAITKDCLKVMVNEVKTKAVDVDTVAVTKFKVDAAKGTITARADISSVLPAEGKALTIAVNVRNGISDYTTEFYPVNLSTESNVTVTDEESTTKVTIKADEDFPESSAGNIVVADGFKDSKPTTVDIEVGGSGTVIFDAKATSQIKANAEQAGAKSVFFKVEDVTTTKPVENADVVLEVTMKTVDENGTEVFNEDNAGEGAEVTIEIPIPEEKDVAYVNSVTLVNDAGEPIQGGVVPGSEDFDKENGILTFKVNHFSKYAIDYVTNDQFKAVTGVSIDSVSVTLQVGDTLRLVATIAPKDATNKKVTWSSSDATKVTVDNTGKITAVAFGKATITVTTKDGNKTADCTVKVSETKTMDDILKTTTGIPESQNLTPPANAWVNSTDPLCKAFVGIDAEGDKLFVIKKEGLSNPPAVCMNDEFEKIDDNTYKRTEQDFTFTVKMTGGKFTSLEFNTNIERIKFLNGTYSAPVSKEYVEIAAKYDGSTVSTLRWYRQSLAITDSGKKAWKGGNGSPVKVPGTGEDVVVGDYFQWGTFTGFYGNGAGTDKGLLPYTSFTSTGCGDGSDAFTFKSGKQFNEEENAPYWSGSAYTKYNTTDNKTELDASDDVASIILGGTWRMPTTKEFQALKEATYWKWDATDKGYYVFIPLEGDEGKINNETSNTYDKADALLFFPAVGLGYEGALYSDDNSIAYYWSRTLYSNLAHAYAMSIDKSEIHPDEEEITARGFGFAIRPVQDPAATYVAVTGVSLDVTAKEIVVGGNVQLKVTVVPATATQNGVYWTSSAPTVATVDATGKVTAVAAGTATITATTVDGSKTATCTVTVTAPVTTFKAVYNTNGDANTLTFFYDSVDHSGEGITVYEGTGLLSTETINNPNNWGYHDKRGDIKSVVIDASVAGYKGLTSTAYMFTNMNNANNISGAEYLDVSNVTDMAGMFYYFGSSLQNFNSVPDVGKWNTASVTNMANMFLCYGNKSEILNAVPDVKEWNTASVMSMNGMFKNYGNSSTALAAVPVVGNWNTGKVTKIKNLFKDYGHTSKNIDCTLDLSGWDLSKITGTSDADDVFNFTPKTFDVTIPAKTGEKSNEGGKWYYGNGTNYIAPPTGKTFTPTLAGALKGVFSVSATKKVHFSQGNLWYGKVGDAQTATFNFEANQYDSTPSEGGDWEASHVSLFFWSKTASVAYAASYSESGTAFTDVFFTNATAETAKSDFTVNGVTGKYRTLSTAEWQYLFNTRTMKNGKDRYTLNITYGGKMGLVLYPDDYDKDPVTGTVTDLPDGVVFLPAAGFRDDDGVYGVGYNGCYWSSSPNGELSAHNVLIDSDFVYPDTDDSRSDGLSVRLVTEVK